MCQQHAIIELGQKLIIGVEKERYAYEQWYIWPGKKRSVIEEQLLISFFQHKTALSFKTRNRLVNFAMLPKYYIVNISPICSISAIFSHKFRYAVFCTEC